MIRRTKPALKRPVVERLEPRRLLHGEGLAWGNGPDLTLSFAPDGTEVAGYSSDLFQTLDGLDSTRVWQDTILRGFQTWADGLGASVTQVADSGAPLGVPGPTQEDPRFGDVRVVAAPLPADIVAISVPHDEIISGTCERSAAESTAIKPIDLQSMAQNDAVNRSFLVQSASRKAAGYCQSVAGPLPRNMDDLFVATKPLDDLVELLANDNRP